MISIILPAYKTPEDYLRQAIDSVLSQTYTNYELLIIDDCPQKPVKYIIGTYQDKRIKYFLNPNNLGMANSRNRGIDLSRGDFIAFLDHDDIWLPQKLEKQLAVFRQKKLKSLVYTRVESIYDNGEIKPQQGLIVDSNSSYESEILHNKIISTSCIIIPKIIFQDNPNLRFKDYAVPCDDYDLYLQLSLKYPIYVTEEFLVQYRYHSGNTSSNKIVMYKAKMRVLRRQYRYILASNMPLLKKISLIILVLRSIFYIYRHTRNEV